MTTSRILLAAALFLPSLAMAQKLDLKLDSLVSKATEKAEVDVDPSLLGSVLQGNVPGSGIAAAAKEVHVRNYKFSKEGGYSDKDLEPLRKQLGEGSGWSRIINVKEKNESNEVFTFVQGGQIRAFLVVACEAREVNVVYLVGDITEAQLKSLVSSTIHYKPDQAPAKPAQN